MRFQLKSVRLVIKFVKKYFDREKIYELFSLFLLFSYVILFNPYRNTYIQRNFYNFHLIDYFNALMFFSLIIYGSFLVYRWQNIRISLSISVLFIAIILTAIIWLILQKDIMVVALMLWFCFCVYFIIKKKVNNKFGLNFKQNFSINKVIYICSFIYILITVSMQLVWSFKSPDASGYFISAKNLLEHNSLDVYNPLIQYSLGFVRKLFYPSSCTTIRIQYPIGSIFFLAFFIKYASFWRIIFPLVSIVLLCEFYEFYVKLHKKPLSLLQFSGILFLPQILILLTTDISFDLIALSLSIVAINNFNTKEDILSSKKLIIVIICTFSIGLIKASILVFLMLVLSIIFIYRYTTDADFKEKLHDFIVKNKLKIVFVLILGTSTIIVGAYFAFSGYSQKWSLLYKVVRPFQIMKTTIINFSINMIQIMIVYFPYIVSVFFNKITLNQISTTNVRQKWKITLPLSIAFIIFIFFWNSSNLYPFDIGARYFILIGVILWGLCDFSQLKRQWKKFFIFYIILLDAIFLPHAFILDQRNSCFAREIYQQVNPSSIIITDYYSKLFPDRVVYVGTSGNLSPNEIINDIQKLILNFTVYFIPDGDSSYNKLIFSNFQLTLVYKYNHPIILPFPRTIFGINIIDPAPRELYLIIDSKL